MNTVGVRELKAHLSRHLKRVRAGARLIVTERGRSIAALTPVDAPTDVGWALALVAEGRASWSGGKPMGASPQGTAGGNRRVSTAIIEDRR